MGRSNAALKRQPAQGLSHQSKSDHIDQKPEQESRKADQYAKKQAGVLHKVIHLFSKSAAPQDKSAIFTSPSGDSKAFTDSDQGGNKFLIALNRIKDSVDYNSAITAVAPYGYYMGRPIIGEGTQINGGIFVGAIPQEAIVIDRKYILLECLESELINRLEKRDNLNSIPERLAVAEALHMTRSTLAYDAEGVKKLCAREKLEPDQKVAIDIFVKEQVGVARHQVLLAGYLLEALKRRNILGGCVYIEHQMRNNGTEDERLIYTSVTGQILIFDPGSMELF